MKTSRAVGDTFGCELALLSDEADSLLSDPIHEKLWENNRCQLTVWIVREISSKEQIRREEYADHPKAISVPMNGTGMLPAKAFFDVVTPLSDRHGDTATHLPQSNCPALWLQWRMLYFKNVVHLPQW